MKKSKALSEYKSRPPKDFPLYVQLGNHTTMKLKRKFSLGCGYMPIPDGYYYYRDNGLWGIDAQIINGRLLAVARYKEVRSAHHIEFKKITKKQWAEENDLY